MWKMLGENEKANARISVPCRRKSPVGAVRGFVPFGIIMAVAVMLQLASPAAEVTPWTNPLVRPSGEWKAWRDDGAWQFAWVSERAGDAVEVEFEGTSFSVCHRKGACRWIWGITFRDQTSPLGLFEAFVDGKSAGVFDSSLREETCVAKGLADGRHVARIVNLGRSTRKGGPGRIALRGFLADRAPRLPTPDPRRESPELAKEVRSLPSAILFTGSPLRSGAVPNYIWQSNPDGPWGCSIRIVDFKAGNARVIFEEPDSVILDMSLSPDASKVLFSMRRHHSKTWQIYEMKCDGTGLRPLTDTPLAHNASPVALPGGRIAFLSTRTPFTHNVCQPGPSAHVHVMDANGGNVRDLSSNTLSDLYLTTLSDGRLLYTRWEYVDWNLTYRQSLWTQYPDGRQMALWFGNLTEDPATIIQAREIPGEYGSAVCTFAPHHKSPYGAIGVVSNREGPEGDAAPSMRWLTPEYPSVFDSRMDWGWCWPAPVGRGRFLASCGDGAARRFRLMLLAEDGRRAVAYEDPATSVFGAVPFAARPEPKEIAPFVAASPASVTLEAAPPGQPEREEVEMGRLFVSDVYRGFAESLPRGEVKAVRVMEQLPKAVNRTWNGILDQGPLVGASSYYPKRVWGYAPVEADGSAFFLAPARKEIYLQLVDGEGRELVRMTSAINLMPGETQSCAGCHENRRTAAAPSAAIASRGGPVPLTPPAWGNAGVLDYNKVVQPVWNRHCVRCHSGANPPKGMNLSGHYTRFFNMSYDSLVIRSNSDNAFRAWFTGDSAVKPLVQSFHLLSGLTEPFRAKESGTFGSRLPEYLEKSHHGVDMPAADKRIVYEWLDAMIPYYPTFDFAHVKGKGDRDKWGEPDSAALKPWFTKRFLPLYEKSCASCHGNMDLRVANTNFVEPQWWWFDLTEPAESPALTAHLPVKEGGRGYAAKGRFSFSSRQDALWTELLDIAKEAAKEAWRTPEADMPGFVPRSRGRCEYRP